MPSPRPAPRPGTFTLLAGGDICLGKGLGKTLLDDPTFDPFEHLTGLLATADVRFANLESQISDQKGETQHPKNPLVFVGPPIGADALGRAGFDLVSLANNHMWDYGERAFYDTLDHLDRVGVAYVGAGRNFTSAYGPVILERNGVRVAIVAVTDIWNQGVIWSHAARDRVAAADLNAIGVTVRALKKRSDIDLVVVSQHGGGEYLDTPLPFTRKFARAAIDAGADAFLGHHPHVFHGVEMRKGKPIFYSLGSFVMRVSREHPDAPLGMVARLALRRGEAPTAEVCPVRNADLKAYPLAVDPQRAATEAAFTERFQRISGNNKPAAALGAFTPEGCAPLIPEPTSGALDETARPPSGRAPVAQEGERAGGKTVSARAAAGVGKLGQGRGRDPSP
ncbi:CapA family protein [Chondromyces crocatus]|nr:CapA family protein [Chondromyces crocatus]